MKIALVGYGRMGHEIESVAKQRGHSIELIIDKDNVEQFTAENLKSVDVVIEFTTPSEAFANVCKAFKAGVPVVSGTTGWLDKMEEARRVCLENNGAFFYASNFSIGVNVMFAVNRKLAQLMRDFSQYDVTVEETHHTGKVDAPSGTAITLAETIIDNLDRKTSWELDCQDEKPNVINVTAQRIGEVSGTHSVTYSSEVDDIIITHQAHNRKGFALGAVLAAEFMKGKTGFYGMKDLIK
jgi:4-hydroxy-tetrahydrodipicolinate reductase